MNAVWSCGVWENSPELKGDLNCENNTKLRRLWDVFHGHQMLFYSTACVQHALVYCSVCHASTELACALHVLRMCSVVHTTNLCNGICTVHIRVV